MKKKNITKPVILMAMVILIATAGTSFAGRGWGGRGQGDYDCPGGGPGFGYGRGNMSAEDLEQMQALRQKFYQDTQELRLNIESKELELRSEFIKENPDVEKLKGVQAELSALQAQLDQKRIEHRLEMRKINPDAGRGFMMGHGPKGGRGFRGGGGCWR
jgi:Spy/CpxP family protein refolding chaperone